MAFSVMNVVRTSREELPGLLAEVKQLGLDALRAQAGFRAARMYQAEDGTEAVTITEWDSREHFLAYRDSDEGRRMVSEAIRWKPRISFYEVVAAVDA
jgi:heme-degrading monooxygenase HmoA